MKKKKKHGLMRALSALLGFACALVLGALFYGTMVYQLAGEDSVQESSVPGAVLTLPAQLKSEETREIICGGQLCQVITRTYALDDGEKAMAVTASPAAYFEHLSAEGFVPQLVTGFTLAGLDAICMKRGDRSLLAARSGEYVYLLEAAADEQTLYALGAGAVLE